MVRGNFINPIRNKAGFILIFFFLFNINLSGSEIKDDTGDDSRGKIVNLYDAEMGHVDEKGLVSNKFGKNIGSVDTDGIIYNVNNIVIGKVGQDGTVFNQSGTKMGSVNEEGHIFNVSGRMVGSVKGIEDIKLTGGAGRLIFLK